MVNRLFQIFGNHSQEIAIASFVLVFAYVGVFGPVGSIAGALGLLVMLVMAGLLVYQFLKAIPEVKDGVRRNLDQWK